MYPYSSVVSNIQDKCICTLHWSTDIFVLCVTDYTGVRKYLSFILLTTLEYRYICLVQMCPYSSVVRNRTRQMYPYSSVVRNRTRQMYPYSSVVRNRTRQMCPYFSAVIYRTRQMYQYSSVVRNSTRQMYSYSSVVNNLLVCY
jgi:hypothetical protein